MLASGGIASPGGRCCTLMPVSSYDTSESRDDQGFAAVHRTHDAIGRWAPLATAAILGLVLLHAAQLAVGHGWYAVWGPALAIGLAVASIRLVAKADLAIRSNPPSKRMVLEKLILDLTTEIKPEETGWRQEELPV